MKDAELSLREFEHMLKGHPRSEIREFCTKAGFTQRQIDATMLNLFNDFNVSVEVQADRLDMSVSTFNRRKKVLAGQLYTWLIHNGVEYPYKMKQI